MDFVTSDCGNKDMGSIETAKAINIKNNSTIVSGFRISLISISLLIKLKSNTTPNNNTAFKEK